MRSDEGPSVPAALLNQSLRALDAQHVPATVIGSLAALEHIDRFATRRVATEDVDLLLSLDDRDSVARVENSMRALGLVRPPGREGKWLLPGYEVGVDLLSRTLPTGFGSPACLEEPFANVLALDSRPAVKLVRALNIPLGYQPTVAGPFSTVLGKALKVVRYLGLPDWPYSHERQRRAMHSMWIAVVVVQQNGRELDDNHVRHFAARCDEAGEEVTQAFVSGVKAAKALLGRADSPGIRLAAAWGNDHRWDLSDVTGRVTAMAESAGQHARGGSACIF